MLDANKNGEDTMNILGSPQKGTPRSVFAGLPIFIEKEKAGRVEILYQLFSF
jgi:hypothetical protein